MRQGRHPAAPDGSLAAPEFSPMLSAALGLAAIAFGLALVLADHSVGRFSIRGPEAGAALARGMGMVLIVAGGLAFLASFR
jgi:hypothetical protein